MSSGEACQLSFSAIQIWNNDPAKPIKTPEKACIVPTSDASALTEPPILLCDKCSGLSLSSLFALNKNVRPQRRRVGSLDRCHANRTFCRFCRFIIEACELEHPSGWEDVSSRRSSSTDVYLANDRNKSPWYSVIAVATKQPPCPFTWLEIGHFPRKEQQRSVCINVVPDLDQISYETNTISPRVRRTIDHAPGNLDCDQIKSWLQICIQEHPTVCGIGNNTECRLSNFYLIDIEARRIVRAALEHQYIALSYVWGGIRHTSKEWSWASHEVTLADGERAVNISSRLPATIEDATTLTARLGQRYLWVDALCINQDDPRHREEQINNMDMVYQSALLTILAMDGSNADAGLAGVSRPLEQNNQPKFDVSAGTLTATYRPAATTEAGSATWDQRAWTMQECLLSRRCIILDRNQVIWKCRDEYFHDCLGMTLSDNRPKFQLSNEVFWENCNSVNLTLSNWSFGDFSDFLSIYSARKLTHPMDIINACQGILNHWTRQTGIRWICGLPRSHFLPSLLWKSHADYCIARRPEFPSWSWSGWKGRIEYTYWLHDAENLGDSVELDNSNGHLDHNMEQRKVHRGFTATSKHQMLDGSQVKFQTTGPKRNVLEISSFAARVKLSHVQNHGQMVNSINSKSLQQRVAIGDHWTFLDSKSRKLRDLMGEYHTFEKTDHFFRDDPETSQALRMHANEAMLLFVKYFPSVRDSEQSSNWIQNVVAALLLLPYSGDSMTRIASMALPLEYWVDVNPQFRTVRIV